MKVFKFFSGEFYYAVSGESEEQAHEALFDLIGEMHIDDVKEIPESQWDEKIIAVYEDNDMEQEPFFESIRENMFGSEPTLIFTNDLGTL